MAYRYRLDPAPEQLGRLRRFAGSFRYVYNLSALVKKRLRRPDTRIRQLQRIRSAKIERKAFGSAYHTLCNKIRKLWLRIDRIRRDFLHKPTTRMEENQRHAAVEVLEIRRMTRAERTYKRDLNRSIPEQGWYRFRVFLRYRLERRGRLLLEIAPKNMSATCSAYDAFPYGNASPLRDGRRCAGDRSGESFTACL